MENFNLATNASADVAKAADVTEALKCDATRVASEYELAVEIGASLDGVAASVPKKNGQVSVCKLGRYRELGKPVEVRLGPVRRQHRIEKCTMQAEASS